jgi:polyisoprenoid-binding protein YceI/rhodanese-related sulfurtransferase
MKTVSPDMLKSWQEQTYTLIHVLPEEHYQNLHIKGAINICVYEVSFLEKVKNLNLDSEAILVLYGESENELDAKVAAIKLDRLGFKNVYVLEGGLGACIDVFPLEGEREETDTDQLLSLEDGVYTLVEQSTLEWTGANVNGKHFGVVVLKSGHIEVKDSQLSGEFIIDMNTVKTLDLSREQGADHLDAHLRSGDFFLTKLFPEAKYSFVDAGSVQTPYQTDINYVLDGELTLRGITKKQRINTLISRLEKRLVLTARVEIDRTKWDIVYGSTKFFKFLGMHKIFDNVLIEMRLELEQ